VSLYLNYLDNTWQGTTEKFKNSYFLFSFLRRMGLVAYIRKKSSFDQSKRSKKGESGFFVRNTKTEKRFANPLQPRNGQKQTRQRIASTSDTITIRASSSSIMVDTEDAVAAADKEMEERAARAKALLANRYKGLRTDQVRFTFSRNYRQKWFI
jgi:hypothetical protein